VMFLVWRTYPIANFSHSFLLGWLIKAAVTKFGGGKAYHRTVPLMIGVIAGDLLGGLIFNVHGVLHYFAVGAKLPSIYRIFPG